MVPQISWSLNPVHYGQISKAPESKELSINFSKRIASIEGRYQGQNKTVICIQDLHCHYEVQKNITKIIQTLVENYQLKLIAVEGASGVIDPGIIKQFPLSSVKMAVSNYLVKQGKLTGADYFAVTTDKKDIVLEGIETQDLYDRSMAVVQRLLTTEIQGILYDWRDELEQLRPLIYSQPLMAVDQLKQDYRDGRLDLLAFANKLWQFANNYQCDLDSFSLIKKYLSLEQQLWPTDQSPQQLFRQLEQLEKSIRHQLYQTPLQVNLDQQFDRLDIIERVLNISATPSELHDFKKNRKQYTSRSFFDFIINVSPEQGKALLASVVDWTKLDQALDEAAEFYQLADERSRHFVNNLINLMDKHDQKLAVMINGGFHSPEVAAVLEDRHVSYLMVKPVMTIPDMVNPYFDLLQNRETPLEKLFAKNQTILAVANQLQTLNRYAHKRAVIGSQLFAVATMDHESAIQWLAEEIGPVYGIKRWQGEASRLRIPQAPAGTKIVEGHVNGHNGFFFIAKEPLRAYGITDQFVRNYQVVLNQATATHYYAFIPENQAEALKQLVRSANWFDNQVAAWWESLRYIGPYVVLSCWSMTAAREKVENYVERHHHYSPDQKQRLLNKVMGWVALGRLALMLSLPVAALVIVMDQTKTFDMISLVAFLPLLAVASKHSIDNLIDAQLAGNLNPQGGTFQLSKFAGERNLPRLIGLGLIFLSVLFINSAVFEFVHQPITVSVIQLAVFIILALYSVTGHEYSHARMALFFGDDTGLETGRLNLWNPFKHISLLGTILFPLVFYSLTGFLLFWLKPIQVSDRLTSKQLQWVALAGPAANVVLGAMSLLGPGSAWAMMFFYAAALNFIMALVNLLPVFPMDGNYIFRFKLKWYYQIAIFLFFVYIGFPFLIAAIQDNGHDRNKHNAQADREDDLEATIADNCTKVDGLTLVTVHDPVYQDSERLLEADFRVGLKEKAIIRKGRQFNYADGKSAFDISSIAELEQQRPRASLENVLEEYRAQDGRYLVYKNDGELESITADELIFAWENRMIVKRYKKWALYYAPGKTRLHIQRERQALESGYNWSMPLSTESLKRLHHHVARINKVDEWVELETEAINAMAMEMRTRASQEMNLIKLVVALHAFVNNNQLASVDSTLLTTTLITPEQREAVEWAVDVLTVIDLNQDTEMVPLGMRAMRHTVFINNPIFKGYLSEYYQKNAGAILSLALERNMDFYNYLREQFYEYVDGYVGLGYDLPEEFLRFLQLKFQCVGVLNSCEAALEVAVQSDANPAIKNELVALQALFERLVDELEISEEKYLKMVDQEDQQAFIEKTHAELIGKWLAAYARYQTVSTKLPQPERSDQPLHTSPVLVRLIEKINGYLGQSKLPTLSPMLTARMLENTALAAIMWASAAPLMAVLMGSTTLAALIMPLLMLGIGVILVAGLFVWLHWDQLYSKQTGQLFHATKEIRQQMLIDFTLMAMMAVLASMLVGSVWILFADVTWLSQYLVLPMAAWLGAASYHKLIDGQSMTAIKRAAFQVNQPIAQAPAGTLGIAWMGWRSLQLVVMTPVVILLQLFTGSQPVKWTPADLQSLSVFIINHHMLDYEIAALANQSNQAVSNYVNQVLVQLSLAPVVQHGLQLFFRRSSQNQWPARLAAYYVAIKIQQMRAITHFKIRHRNYLQPQMKKIKRPMPVMIKKIYQFWLKQALPGKKMALRLVEKNYPLASLKLLLASIPDSEAAIGWQKELLNSTELSRAVYRAMLSRSEQEREQALQKVQLGLQTRLKTTYQQWQQLKLTYADQATITQARNKLKAGLILLSTLIDHLDKQPVIIARGKTSAGPVVIKVSTALLNRPGGRYQLGELLMIIQAFDQMTVSDFYLINQFRPKKISLDSSS